MLGTDSSVYVCGENAFDPFYFAQKSLDIDGVSQSPFATSRYAEFIP